MCAARKYITNQSDELACYLPSCNDVKCCLSVEPLQRRVMVDFRVDHCQQLLYIEIEQFQVQISLIDFEWNKEHELYLKGVIRLA